MVASVMGFAIIFTRTAGDRAALDPTSPALLQFAVILQGFLDVGILVFMLALVKWRYKLPAWSGLGWHQLPQGKMSRGYTVSGLIAGGILLSFVVGAARAIISAEREVARRTSNAGPSHRAIFPADGRDHRAGDRRHSLRGFLYPVVARAASEFPQESSSPEFSSAFSTAASFGNNLWLVVIMSTVGALFTWIRARLDTVLASFIVHTAYNGVQVAGVLIVTHGLTRALPHT